MPRSSFRRLHLVSSVLALLLPAAFLTATVGVELFGDAAAILTIKRGIAWGLVVLVPSMAAAALSGKRLAGRSRAGVIVAKQRRTRIAALNGILVLVPSAIALYVLAARGDFGRLFVTVQTVELIAGPINVGLLALNARDGLRLSGRAKRPVRAAEA